MGDTSKPSRNIDLLCILYFTRDKKNPVYGIKITTLGAKVPKISTLFGPSCKMTEQAAISY